MEKIIRVGKMPGRITEVVVNEGATVKEVIELAGLDASGFDIKVDGNLANQDDKVGEANLVILAQQVKGNADGIIRVGKMPGRITEVLAPADATVSDVLELAGLDYAGFDIKVDGNLAKLEDAIGEANLVILAQQVKGNK